MIYQHDLYRLQHVADCNTFYVLKKTLNTLVIEANGRSLKQTGPLLQLEVCSLMALDAFRVRTVRNTLFGVFFPQTRPKS